jgi:predicted dithiol-disulfide oxidoreductase (DUF899 family)
MEMTMITFPNESAEYRAARETLLQKEIELRRAMEDVAVARRALPPGGLVPEDYVFDGLGADGKPARIKLSELFSPGKDTLIVYSMMFPRHPQETRDVATSGGTAKLARADQPCPSCTALLDQFDGAIGHLEAAGFNFAVVGKTALENMITLGRDRGWANMRLLSSASNSFKRDYHAEAEDGAQLPMLSVFHRDADGIPMEHRQHPPFLEFGAWFRALRTRPGSARRRHLRALVEPDGFHAGGPAELGRAAAI